MIHEDKEEYEQCLQKAKLHILRGEFEKGESLISKAKRICPSYSSSCELLLELDDLLRHKRQQQSSATGGQTRSSSPPSSPSPSPSTRIRSAHEIDDEEVKRILKRRDNLYQVLDVETSATTDKIEKVYKKMARKIHPDRNHSPSATDAFRVLQSAKETLSDPYKRQMYNYALANPSAHLRTSAERASYQHAQVFDPDELIRIIFSRGRAFQHQHRHQNQHQDRREFQQARTSPSSPLSSLLSITMMFSMIVLSFFLFSEKEVSAFSSTPSIYYSVPLRTSNGIGFFVPAGSKLILPESAADMSLRQQTERKVEEMWLQWKSSVCTKEKARSSTGNLPASCREVAEFFRHSEERRTAVDVSPSTKDGYQSLSS